MGFCWAHLVFIVTEITSQLDVCAVVHEPNVVFMDVLCAGLELAVFHDVVMYAREVVLIYALNLSGLSCLNFVVSFYSSPGRALGANVV